MTWDALEKAGADLMRRLGPSALRTVVDHASMRGPATRSCARRRAPRPCSTRWRPWTVRPVCPTSPAWPRDTPSGRPRSAWRRCGAARASHHVPVRATAAVLADVVREARHELLLMTYSARPHQPLSDALGAAISRGVAVTWWSRPCKGAGSALSGDEPYQAFTGIPGIELWHWPASTTDRIGREDARQARRRRSPYPAGHQREPHPVRRHQEHRSRAAHPRWHGLPSAPPSTSTPCDPRAS